MQTFGKRQYAHMELDPWAMKKKPRAASPRERSIPTTRVTGGVIAVAGFRMLVLA